MRAKWPGHARQRKVQCLTLTSAHPPDTSAKRCAGFCRVVLALDSAGKHDARDHHSRKDVTMILKRFYSVFILALLFTASSLATATAAPDGAQIVDEAWRKAMTANNLDAIMAVYAEDAVMWLPDAPEAKGREAIRKSYAELLAGNTVTGASFANARYQTSGDLSIGWGDFTLTLAPKGGGSPVTLNGRFSVMAKKERGTWVYVVDHASAHPKPQ